METDCKHLGYCINSTRYSSALHTSACCFGFGHLQTGHHSDEPLLRGVCVSLGTCFQIASFQQCMCNMSCLMIKMMIWFQHCFFMDMYMDERVDGVSCTGLYPL